MDVTESGMTTDVRLLQSLKAKRSMDSSEVAFDMSTDTSAEQDAKALSGISVKLVTPDATVKLERLVVVILESTTVNAV